MGVSGVASPSALPSALPSGIIAYTNLNLSASWNVVHSAYVQQMVNLTESSAIYGSYLAYSGSTANFEYFYGNGTVIPAWIQSNSSGKLITLLKIKNTTATNDIYLGFASKTTNLLSSSGTSGIGEAPQLSSTYAEYDDGANVFPVYYNFAGTTLDSRISPIAGVTLTQNNGLSISASTTGTTFYILTTSSMSSPFIMEGYETYYGVPTTSNPNEQYGFVIDSSTSTSQNTGGIPAGTNYMVRTLNDAGSPNLFNGATALAYGTHDYVSQYTAIDNFIQNPTGISATFDGTSMSSATTVLSSGYIGFYLYSDTANAVVSTVQWLRTRAYPPNGVMPSVSFGAVHYSVVP